MLHVNNLPKTLKIYTVARECEGEWWFWGTWDSVSEALSAAREIGGEVFNSHNIYP